MDNQEVKKQEVEVKDAPKREPLTPEQVKAHRAAAAKRTLEKRKFKGIAAKQFFIHKSLFKKAEEIMQPILEESKRLTEAELNA